MEMKSRVYILVDDQNRITRIEGEYTLPDNLDGWTFIEEGAPCDRLNLAQSHYLDKPLINNQGVYQYKFINNKIIERTQEEMNNDKKESEKISSMNQEDRISNLEDTIKKLTNIIGELTGNNIDLENI